MTFDIPLSHQVQAGNRELEYTGSLETSFGMDSTLIGRRNRLHDDNNDHNSNCNIPYAFWLQITFWNDILHSFCRTRCKIER